jgi:class 3 adenylate cyclase/tetratricopeptide (TPR) repeat protein
MSETDTPRDPGAGEDYGDLEQLAARRVEEAHNAWVRAILDQACGKGSASPDAPLHHPFLLPYEQLPAAEKQRCEQLAAAVLEIFRCRLSLPAAAGPAPGKTGESLAAHLLRDLTQADLGETLELWQALKAMADPLPASIYQDLGHHTLRLGEPILAYDMLSAGLKLWPRDMRLRQLLALALLRSGATFQALKILEELRQEGQSSEETLGLLARAYKDLAEQTADPAAQRQRWGKAKEIYAASYAQTGGYWTGINAATMARLLGEEEEAETLALRVKRQCLTELESLQSKATERYWLLATLGEAALIRGEIAEALEWYDQAGEIVGKRYGDLASTRRNLRLLCNALGLAARDRKKLQGCLRVPRVVVFSGHMIDQPGRVFPRFPPQLEGRVARELHRLLGSLEARIGYASAACGSDILFLEAMLTRQGEINIVLPFKKEAFRKTSVEVATNSGWAERFEKVLQRATRVVVACEHRSTGSPVIYEYANLLQDGLAVLRARLLESEAIPVVVWDGRPGDDSGGTASMVEHWLRQGRQPEVIDIAAMFTEPLEVGAACRPATAPAAPAPTVPPLPQEIRAMLFADVVHYSHLLEEQIPHFMQHFMGAMRSFLSEFGTKPLSVNTWGDALHCVFATVAEAGNFALGLRDRLNTINWADQGLPPHLNLRISLHAGPVFVWDAPVFSGLRYSGSHVSRAARIEPITPPGQVYASQQFAALATSLGITDFTCDYVGQIPLPKQAGIIPLYLVRRPNP